MVQSYFSFNQRVLFISILGEDGLLVGMEHLDRIAEQVHALLVADANGSIVYASKEGLAAMMTGMASCKEIAARMKMGRMEATMGMLTDGKVFRQVRCAEEWMVMIVDEDAARVLTAAQRVSRLLATDL